MWWSGGSQALLPGGLVCVTSGRTLSSSGPPFLCLQNAGCVCWGWGEKTGGCLRFLLTLRVYSQLFTERFFLIFFLFFLYMCLF